MFDRFRQADASTTREQRGLGLGLAIVKNLAELHGGSVRAKSPGPNKGSTFTIVLPMVMVNIEADPNRRHPRAVTQGLAEETLDLHGVRVLAVDDEADARHLIKRILSGCGAQVETADSGAAALRFLRKSKPHVLIMDIGMPNEDGYEAIAEGAAIDEPGRRQSSCNRAHRFRTVRRSQAGHLERFSNAHRQTS